MLNWQMPFLTFYLWKVQATFSWHNHLSLSSARHKILSFIEEFYNDISHNGETHAKFIHCMMPKLYLLSPWNLMKLNIIYRFSIFLLPLVLDSVTDF